MIKSVREIVRERIAEASEAALQMFRNAVRPIYGVTDKGDPNHIGSALLLELPEGAFLLTAGHVIDWNKSTSLYLGGDSFALLQLEALVTISPGGDRKKDRADFCVARIDADLLSKLTGAKFIKESDISRSVMDTHGRLYTCLGYPNSKNKVKPHTGTNVVPALGVYTSVGRPASLLTGLPSNACHILVDRDAKYARDENGAKVNAISLPGFSGGAIIDVGKISPANLTGEFDPKLSAMLIEARVKEQVILGIKLSSIVDTVRAHLN